MSLTSKHNKIIVSGLMIVMVISAALTFARPALALDQIFDPWGGQEEEIQATTGLGDRDPRDIAADVIRIILGFLGIIAVIIILLGGFKWMTAGGNEDKVGEARKLIIAGVIGLLIIIASFAIATFVLESLIEATTD